METRMGIVVPKALQSDDLSQAVQWLTDYYGSPYRSSHFTGAHFDGWDSAGTRATSANCFTADDFTALTFLSVNVTPEAALILLEQRCDVFTNLLEKIGPDSDLVDEGSEIDQSWPAWQLETELRALPGIGRTIASKLIARKRPRLCPIWDSVVSKALGTTGAHVEPIRAALRSDDAQLHGRLISAREAVGLPDEVSALRVLDVVAWMDGKARGY